MGRLITASKSCRSAISAVRSTAPTGFFGSDYIDAGAGNDRISAVGTIHGGGGEDQIFITGTPTTGAGTAHIYGDDGNDAIVCTENPKSDHSGDEVRPGWRLN
jgi:hypothetical protein